MTRGDERALPMGRIDHVIFGNEHEQGLRAVAWSVEDRADLDWSDKNLDRFVGLENFLDRTPPTTAFSYVRFRGEMAAVIRRHDDGTGSQGRNRADILIGHRNDLQATTALGLEGLDRVWNVAVPFNRRLPEIPAQVLTEQAAMELHALKARRSDVRDHARQVLATMGTYKDKRLLLVGMTEELKKPLLLVVEDVRRSHPDLFGEVGLTFSTYEAHSQDVQGTPGFVFVPDYPQTGTRRVVVDCTLSGRKSDLPSPEMLTRAEDALDGRSARAGAVSADTAQRPALIGAGGGSTRQSPPGGPRGSGPLSINYAGGDGGEDPYRGGIGAGGTDQNEPRVDRERGRTRRWVDDLLEAGTLHEFNSACERMMREQPDPIGRRAALNPPPTLLDVYRRGVDLIAAFGGGRDTAQEQVLALAFGNDHAELRTDKGAAYLFELVRTTARCSIEDFARVKNLMADVVHEYRNLPTGSSTLQRVLADDYFESLGLDPMASRKPEAPSPVAGPGNQVGGWLSQLTTGVRGSRPVAASGQRTVDARNGVPASASSRSNLARDDKKELSTGKIVAIAAAVVAVALIAFVMLWARDDEAPVPAPAPLPPTPTAAPSTSAAPAEVELGSGSTAGSLTQPVTVQVANLDDVARKALPPQVGSQTDAAVVYVVWHSTTSGSITVGEACTPDPPTSPTAYVCPPQRRPAKAVAPGEVLVVASTEKTLQAVKNGSPAADGLNSEGLVKGMTELTTLETYSN